MSSDDVRSIVEFIYRGELNVGADHFSSVLKIAEVLQIRGLMEVSTEFQFMLWLLYVKLLLLLLLLNLCIYMLNIYSSKLSMAAYEIILCVVW